MLLVDYGGHLKTGHNNNNKIKWNIFGLFLLITLIKAQNICSPSPCGVNTDCTVARSGVAACRCKPGYDHAPGGNTIDGCPRRISSSGGGGFKSAPPPRRTVLGNRLGGGNFGVTRQQPLNINPCSPDPCGVNAQCRPVGDRPLCTCLPNHTGDPYTECRADPCDQDPCGIDAICESSGGNRAICKCPPGYSGDPYVRCDDNPCNQDPCGANADCTSNGNRAVCKCRPNYEGDPFVQCVLDPCLISPCGINADCQKSAGTRSGQSTRAVCKCRDGYEGDPFVRCNLNPCHDNPCGPNADCEARGSSAVCKCREGYVGDPFVNCNLEPCSTDPCGTNAECESNGRTAVCRCPKGYTGDPYTNCRLDPCSTDPCGTNAECSNNGGAAVCKCPPSFVGDPYISCTLDPCASIDACGPNSECQASGTRALCRCRSGFQGDPRTRAGCRADPCGVVDICGRNAECRNEGNRPVCECAPGHKGDPYNECFRGECVSNSECQTNQACKQYNCVDPCLDSCGPGADCTVQNHVAICRCPKGYTGDPFTNCRRFTRSEICAACGANTDCEVTPDDRPICKCKKNYIGNPLTGCRYECERDFDCDNSQHQCVNNRCQPSCRQGVCGENANCQARNHRAVCSCPEDFLGDPYSRCYTECTQHRDCQDNRACVRFKCRDPCFEPNPNVCGSGADCEPKNHKAICSCPRGYTGDPFVSCRQFTRADLCTPNPCGPGATCQPGSDRTGSDRPVCTCPSGYQGDPLVKCVRGECANDNDCGPTRACYDFSCRDPCLNACGANADCRARNHGAICSCPSGYVGDPLIACRQSRNSNRVVGQSNNFFQRRFKRDDGNQEFSLPYFLQLF